MNDQPPPLTPDLDDPDWVEKLITRARERADRSRSDHESDPSVPPTPVDTPPPHEDTNVVPAAAAAPPVVTPPAPPERPARIIENVSPVPDRNVRRDRSVFDDPVADGTGPAPAPVAVATGDADAEAEAADNGDDSGADEEDAKTKHLRGWIEWLAVAGGAVIVALLIRAFVLQAFYIPSESMEPTLKRNDRIMVNKLSYRLHDVHRGDLVVFRRPPNMAATDINDLIKRVIALPGETIELRGSDIYIDDRKLTEPYLPDGTVTVNLGWVNGCANPATERNKCTIPAGHVFVMGDNRAHSSDGRVFGPISEDLIVGRAFIRMWPLSKIGFL